LYLPILPYEQDARRFCRNPIERSLGDAGTEAAFAGPRIEQSSACDVGFMFGGEEFFADAA
jgi:hypothetical protein